MPTELTMPKMGHMGEEAAVFRWLKSVGDRVEEGEIVLEVETEKAILEVESFSSGTLLQILVPEGEVVPIGTPLAIIGEPSDLP